MHPSHVSLNSHALNSMIDVGIIRRGQDSRPVISVSGFAF